MKVLEQQTIGQIVADNYRTVRVFQDFGFDFCCGGNQTIREAATDKNVNPEEVAQALRDLEREERSGETYKEWPLDFLADYIVNTHHRFVRTKLPEMEIYTKKVAKVHGHRHEELHEILRIFLELKDELLGHLTKEEQILFPYIKALVELDEKQQEMEQRPHFGTAANPIAMMEAEHEEAGKAMESIKKLSNDFTPPEDACTTYRVLVQNLESFQEDMHKHIHLENNILFPKALELEKAFRTI